MSRIDDCLKTLGISLPEPPAPRAAYIPYTISGKTLYIAGQIPIVDGKVMHVGKLGRDASIEDGYAAARICAINILAQARAACGGDLDRVARVLRLGGFVNSTPDFLDAPKCVNGASELIVEVFGESGKHARTAVGVASLPSGVAVEVDAILELK